MAAFTSSDEFDLERRVWMTNEYPPYDLSKALNSSMQTPFWKWLLGTTKVEYDVPHKIFDGTVGAYVHNNNSDEVFLKMTNGQVSPNYGPVTSTDSNSKDFNPTYNRIEIDGVVLPEYDLMLHEVYRYLETIYPDHPDERFLLTDNEFNDKILATAEMINYEPDVKFFDKVAENLARTLTTDDVSAEASKIKIRNLVNNSFRRKLYGSKAGYRMFANDIFQICTIFPVATYLPIKPVNPEVIAAEKATLNSKAALDALNMTRKEYETYARKNNRTIDTYSELYHRKFRLVDWDGQDSSYLQQGDENTYLFGYSIPCNENRLYEYPNNDDASAVLDDISVGSTIENTLDDKGITYITDVSNGVFETEVSGYLENNSVMKATSSSSSTKEIHYVITSHTNAINYQTAYLYNLLKDGDNSIIDEIEKDANYKQILNAISLMHSNHFAVDKIETANFFESVYISSKNYASDVEELLNNIKPEPLKVVLNPYVEGTLLLEPKESLTYYPIEEPTKHNIKNADGDLTGEIYLDEVPLVDKKHIFDKYIGSQDLSIYNAGDNTATLDYLYYINGFTKGSISYEMDPTKAETLNDIPSFYEDDRYGIVVNTTNNEKVVLFGNISATYSRDGNTYKADTAKLNITWIPEVKNENMLMAIYDDYKDILQAREILIESMKPFEHVGMTKDGCRDIEKLANGYEMSNLIKYNSEEDIPNSSFGIAKGQVFYKTYNDITLELNSSNIDITEALKLYRDATNYDYSEYFELFLEDSTYEQVVASYRKNRELMTEISSFTPDQAISEDEWSEFNQSTIRPGVTVDRVIQLYGTNKDPLYTGTILHNGQVTDYDLGCLSVLPVINNREEAFSICTYKTGENDTPIMVPTEGYYGVYNFTSSTGATQSIYWPQKVYYKSVNTPHPSKPVNLAGGALEYRVDYNKPTYTELDIDYTKRTKSAADWLANSTWNSQSLQTNIIVIPTKMTPIKIEGVVNVENENLRNTISFESDISREYAKTLSVGDTVYGPTIDSDNNTVFITSIGYNSVTVNTEFIQSGKYLFTFNCKLNIVTDDIENDMSHYKSDLYRYGEYSLVNPFEHGLWGSADFPYTSNAILESLPDISFYKPYNYIAQGAAQVNSFKEVMDKIHPKRYEGDEYIRMPSAIKFMNELFVELNITKVLPTTTRSGKSNILMSVDWLDYISNSLKDISRATDKTNVGVNLMMETDSSGYYTMDRMLGYTDPNVQLKFITMNFAGIRPMWNNNLIDSDNEWTVPAYAQLGTGGSGRFSWFTSPADITYPNIWGNNVYDSDTITGEDLTILNENNGNIRKRSTWREGDSDDVINTEGSSRFKSVEQPLFEIPLGEYDIQTRYLPNGVTDAVHACTTIQASFYAQTFKNLTKYMSADTDKDTGDISSQPIVLNSKYIFADEPINFFEGIDNPLYQEYWEPSSKLYDGDDDELKGTQEIVYPDDTIRNIGTYNIIPTEVVLNNIGKNLSSRTFKDHLIIIKLGETSNLTFQPIFGGVIYDSNIHPIGLSSIKSEMTYHIYINLGFSYVNTPSDEEMLRAIKEKRLADDNRLFWFIFNVSSNPAWLSGQNISKGDIVGLAFTDEDNPTIENLKLVKFNRGYYTATLPVEKPVAIADEEYNLAIGNTTSADISFLKELNTGVTEITLPRKCIAEGSYNFDYTLDAGVTCTGYLYTTSSANTVGLTSNDTQYDIIENDNFDIISEDEVTFNATRAAIYKDEANDAFYTFTDKYTDVDGNVHTFDNLKKVAIKFEEQKYFKNTTYLSGVYKTVASQSSGSSEIINTPTLRQISDITEFNTNYLGTNDKIIRITPMDLRSVYNENLEPILYSKYYDVEGMLRGIDENGNLVISYDNTSNSASEKMLFNSKLKLIVPVDKSFDDTTQSFITTMPDDTYIDFSEGEYTAPSIHSDSVKFTKPILSDDKLASSSQYEFKYFKNLLVLRAAIDSADPTKLIPANNDNGQFAKAYQFVQRNDKIISSLVLSAASDDETNITLNITFNNTPVNNIVFACYNISENAFICVTSDNYIGIASNVMLPETTDIRLDYYGTPSYYDIEQRPIPFGTDYRVTSVDYNENSWILGVNNNNKSSVFSLSFSYTEESGQIILSRAFTTVRTPSIVSEFNNAESIMLPGEHITNVSNGKITQTQAYAKPQDLCVNGKQGDNWTYGPYEVVTDGNDDLESFYYNNITTGDAIYCKGGDLFVKSNIYLTDANGNYTDVLSTDKYWKHVTLPIYTDASKLIYDRLINTSGTTEAYYQMGALCQNVIGIYDFLKDIGKYITKKNGQYYYKDSKVADVIDQSKADTPEELEFWTNFEMMFGGVATSNDRPPLSEIMSTYVPFINILSNIHVMPWENNINGNSVGIEGFISNVKTSKSTKYYYHDGTAFVVKGSAPTWTAGDYSNYKEYLKGVYNNATDKVDIEYYGFGPYVPSTLDDSPNTFTGLYGCDFAFDRTAKLTGSSYDENDYSWYSNYLCNLSIYGLLEDRTKEVRNGDLSSAVFTDDTLLLTTTGGSIITIAKNKLYKSETVGDINNWYPSELPSLGYSYVKSSRVITKHIRTGIDSEFSVQDSYSVLYRPIYEVKSSLAFDNTVLLGGYIKSRYDIEEQFENDIGVDESTVESEHALADRSIQYAKYFFSVTPMVLYSIDGGKTFNIAVPENLPNFSLADKSTVLDANHKNTDGIKLTQSGTYKIGDKVIKTIINGSNSTVYDRITILNNAASLDSTQSSFGGLVVKGMVRENETVKFYLEPYNRNNGDNVYDYMLSSTKDTYNNPVYSILECVSAEDGISDKATTKVETYPRFSLFVSPESNAVKISTVETISSNYNVLQATESEIVFAGNLINKSNTGGKAEVLVSILTQKPVSLPDQVSMINPNQLYDYFDDEECLIASKYEVPNFGNADLMYNYRETLSGEDLLEDTIGYKALSEDANKIFYEYNEAYNGSETLYTPKVLSNGHASPIYLCDENGNVLYKDSNIVNILSLKGLIEDSRLDDTVYARAHSPKYTSLENAIRDTALREEDTDLKDLIQLSNIQAIDRSYQDMPLAQNVDNPDGLRFLDKDNYISVIDGQISVHRDDPTNTKIGNDIQNFELNNILNYGKFYYKYIGDDIILANGDSIYNDNGVISIISDTLEKSVYKYVNEATLSDIMELSNAGDMIISYKGVTSILIGTNSYIVNDGYGNITVESTKPNDGIDAGNISQLNINTLATLDIQDGQVQRKYIGGNFDLETGSYIIKTNNGYTIQGNLPYERSLVDASNLQNILSLSNGKYTATQNDITLAKDTYIKNENGTITAVSDSPVEKTEDLTVFDINDIMSMRNNTYKQYTGNTKVILNGSYIVNYNDHYYYETENPNNLTCRYEGNNLKSFLDTVINLSNKEYAHFTGESISNNKIILYKNKVLSLEDPSESTEEFTSSKAGFSETVKDLIKNASQKHIKYSLPSQVTIAKDSFVIKDGNTLKSVEKNTLTNVNGTSIEDILSLKDNNICSPTVDLALNKGAILYVTGGRIAVANKSIKELKSIQLSNIVSIKETETIKYTGESFNIVDKGKFITKNSTGILVEDSISEITVNPSIESILADLKQGSSKKYFVTEDTVLAKSGNKYAYDSTKKVASLAESGTDVIFTAKKDIKVNAGDEFTLTLDGTLTVKNKAFAVTDTFDKIAKIAESDYLYTLNDIVIGKTSCIENIGGIIKINAGSIYRTRSASSEVVTSISDVFNKVNSIDFYYKYTGNKVSISKGNNYIRYNGQLQTYVAHADFWEMISASDQTVLGLYTGASFNIYKNGYIINSAQGVHINENPTVGLARYNDYESLQDAFSKNANIAAYIAVQSLIGPYVVNHYGENCNAASIEVCYLPSEEKTYIFGEAVSHNAFVKHTGNSIYVYNNRYILHNLNGTYTITKDAPLVKGPNLNTFDISKLFTIPENTYIKYTGDDYKIVGNSFIVNNGDKSFIDLNFPMTNKNELEELDFNALCKSSDGNYYYTISEDLSIQKGTIIRNNGDNLEIVPSISAMSDADTDVVLTSKWYVRYNSESLYINNGFTYNNGLGTRSYSTLKDIIYNKLINTQANLKLESDDGLGIIVETGTYIIFDGNNISISDSFNHKDGYTRLHDIENINCPEDFINAFANLSIDEDNRSNEPVYSSVEDLLLSLRTLEDGTSIQYKGDTLSIKQGTCITFLNGMYYITNTVISDNNINFNTFNLNDIISMPVNSYMRYTGDKYTLTTGSYIVGSFDNAQILESPTLTDLNVFSLKHLSTLSQNTYYKYTGNSISLYDMGIYVAAYTDSVENLLYSASERNTLIETIKKVEEDIIDSYDISDDVIAARIEERHINGGDYLFDKSLGYFPIKPIKYVSFQTRIGYNVSAQSKLYTKASLHDIDNENSSALPNAITSIFLQQRGYGGTRLRTETDNSWQHELPWDLDSVAFEDSHLVNKYGEIVTLCDSLGKEIISDNGEFPVVDEDTLTVATSDIAEDSFKTVSLLKFGDIISEKCSINIYKMPVSKKFIWTNRDEVNVNLANTEEQALVNIYLSEPSNFKFIAIGNEAVIYSSTDDSRYTEDSNFYVRSGCIYFKSTNAISNKLITSIKVVYNNLEKIIEVKFNSLENYVYSTIEPVYYNYLDGIYRPIVKIGQSTAIYSIGSTRKVLENSKTQPNTTDTIDTVSMNLPVFYIGKTKSYFMYDETYDNGLSIGLERHLRRESYIDDIKVTSKVSCSLDEDGVTYCTYNDGEYSFKFDTAASEDLVSLDSYMTLESGSFVVTNNDELILKVHTSEENIYAKGAIGPVYMRKPTYNSFRDLIKNEQFIIKSYDDIYNASSVKNGKDSLMDISFNMIETNGVTFTKELPYDALNDGNSHFIRIEVLPQKTVPTTSVNLYGDDYEEISLSEIDLFPPDRVYFNPKGYPASPVTINNTIFNSENNLYYSNSLLTNNNNKFIRECDSNGHFIKYTVRNGKLEKSLISFSNDDEVEDTFIPNSPNYMSCKDWFEGEFYIKGSESNPFWQVINLTSTFNNITQSWTQVLSLNKFEKVGRNIKQVAVSDDEAYVSISNASFAEVLDDELRQFYNCNYLDLFEGKIRFIVTEPENNMYNSATGNTQIIKFGICGTNTIKDTFHPERGNTVNIPGYLQSSYTVNSRQNFANPSEKDSAIVEVTELGIFNKAHVLIAYAVFPPIEYRSDTQHISFTSFIKYGNCSVESEENDFDD